MIRGKRQQQPFDRRREVAARAGSGKQPVVAVDADRHGNAAARFGFVADIGNDRSTGERNARGVIFKPFRKPLPGTAARELDCFIPVRIAQTHEGEVDLQQRDQRVGESGCHGRGFPADPHSRDRR